MISKKKAEQIWNEVLEYWRRNGKQEDSLEPVRLAAIKMMIFMFPHEDGNQRVVDMRTGYTHLVPLKDILLHGINSVNLDKYLVEFKGSKK